MKGLLGVKELVATTTASCGSRIALRKFALQSDSELTPQADAR